MERFLTTPEGLRKLQLTPSIYRVIFVRAFFENNDHKPYFVNHLRWQRLFGGVIEVLSFKTRMHYCLSLYNNGAHALHACLQGLSFRVNFIFDWDRVTILFCRSSCLPAWRSRTELLNFWILNPREDTGRYITWPVTRKVRYHTSPLL